MHKQLFELDTQIFADSVEAVPNSNNGFFISGTYQLDEVTRKRNGRIQLHQLTGDDNQVKSFSKIDMPGVLDMKFNPEEDGNQHTLAVALSDGNLSFLTVDLFHEEENVWANKEKVLIDSESTICLSVDWSNQMQPNSSPSVAVSLSNGEMSICSVQNGSYSVSNKWKAHTLPYVDMPAEVWITSFDPLDSNLVYSGGDDCLMKLWDLRTVGDIAVPCSINRQFEAGVTSMCWNRLNPQNLTVGSYDGHIRIFDKRNITKCVCDHDLENNAGIWRIKYKHNCNYYLDKDKNYDVITGNEMLLAAMRAGFIVVTWDGKKEIKPVLSYLNQGTESLAYGVDYIYKKGLDSDVQKGYVGSCSFYNHLMHVWEYCY